MKKPIPTYAKVLLGIAIALLLFFLLGYFFFAAKISSWTNGAIFGLNVESISLEALENGEIRTVTEKEVKSYQKYANNLHKQAVRDLDKDQKEMYKFYSVLPELMYDLIYENVEADEDEISRHVDKLMASATLDADAKAMVKSSLFELTAYADETSDTEDGEMNVIHNLAEALYLARDYKMSTALAALSAVHLPYHSPTADLLGNLLKENEDMEESLKMYEYAVRCAPDSEASLVAAGNACIDLGRLDQAAGYFQKAFTITGGSGPANQGMMLVCLARGDYGSAYLYMIEGAKEGYTSVLTDAYVFFRRKYNTREEYLDFCGPILDQYGFRNLTDFTRTRLAFDPTLDTPAQQLKLDRTFVLPSSGADMINSAVLSLNDGLFVNASKFLDQICGPGAFAKFISTGDISALTSSETYGYLVAEYGYNLKGATQAAGNLINTLKDGDASALEKLAGTWDTAMEAKDTLGYQDAGAVGVDGANYEQEVFWLRILTDYTEYKFNQIKKKYYEDLENKYIWDPLDRSYIRLENRTNQVLPPGVDNGTWAKLLEILGYFVTNGSPIASRQYTLNEVSTVGNEVCGFVPYLKKGYMECVMLAEEYWLYTNNILGMIADDGIYNRMRANRDYMAVQVAIYFPMMSGSNFGTIGITANAWGGITFDWWGDTGKYWEVHSALHEILGPTSVAYPELPDLPITGMGTEVKPPIQIVVKLTDMPTLEDAFGMSEDSPPGTMTIKIEPDDDSMVQVETSGTAAAEDPAAPSEPSPGGTEKETTITVDPALTVGFSFQIKGHGVDLSFNPLNNSFSVSVKVPFVGGTVEYNPVSSDATVLLQIGPDIGKSLWEFAFGGKDLPKDYTGADKASIGNMASFKAVTFLKGTLNLDNLTSSSVETGAEGEYTLLNSGDGYSFSYDILSGVSKETIKDIMLGRTISTEESAKTSEGLLEILDFSRWFK